MNTGFMIITNNPLVKEKLGEDYHVEYEELSYEDTLKKVQKMIFQGYRLLTHPLLRLCQRLTIKAIHYL